MLNRWGLPVLTAAQLCVKADSVSQLRKREMEVNIHNSGMLLQGVYLLTRPEFILLYFWPPIQCKIEPWRGNVYEIGYTVYKSAFNFRIITAYVQHFAAFLKKHGLHNNHIKQWACRTNKNKKQGNVVLQSISGNTVLMVHCVSCHACLWGRWSVTVSTCDSVISCLK